MIRFQRTAGVSRGKGAEATQWAKEVTEYINTHFPEVQLLVFAPRFGALNTIHWIADVEDLASLDRWQQQIGADEGYLELLSKATDLLIAGSIVDAVLMSI